MSSRISKKKKAFLPKTIDWFRLPEYIKSLFEAEPDNTAELLLAFDSEGNPVTVDKSTISGGTGGVQTIVAGTGIAVDNTDPENPIVTNIGGGGTVTLTSQLTNDGADSTSTYVELDELAPVALSGDYTELTNVPIFATVATTGDYNDLLNLPTIPLAPIAGVGITDNMGTFDLGDPAINQDIVWDLIPITVGRDLRKIAITNDTDGRLIEFHQEGITIDSERISATLSGSATFNSISQFAVNQSLTGTSEVGDVSTNDGMYVNADQILFNARNLLQIRPGNDITDPSQIGYALVKTDATGTTEWAEIVAGDSNTTEYTEAAVEPVVGEPISDAFVAANPNKLLFFFDTDNGQTWFYNRDDEGDGTWETLIYQPDPIVPLQNTYITQTGGTFQFQPIYAELDSVSYQNAADLTINFNGLFTNNTDRRHNYIINESDNVISFTSTATEFIVPAGKLAQITGKGVVRFFQYSEGTTSVIVLSGDLDDAASPVQEIANFSSAKVVTGILTGFTNLATILDAEVPTTEDPFYLAEVDGDTFLIYDQDQDLYTIDDNFRNKLVFINESGQRVDDALSQEDASVSTSRYRVFPIDFGNIAVGADFVIGNIYKFNLFQMESSITRALSSPQLNTVFAPNATNTLIDGASGDVLVTKDWVNANSGGSTKYNQTFVSGDFVSSVLTITAITHGVGTKPLTQVYDASGSIVDIDINRNASGDVTLTVIPGNEFDGEVTIL